MGQINVHEFISLDGVVEDPRWTMDFPFDPKMGETISQFMGPSKAILLGRRTYEMFYPAWSTRSADDDPGAPFFNETAKYVVSGTLETAEWNNSQILGAYDPNAIRNLKEQVDGDIYVSGSISLVRAMYFLVPLFLFAYIITSPGERRRQRLGLRPCPPGPVPGRHDPGAAQPARLAGGGRDEPRLRRRVTVLSQAGRGGTGSPGRARFGPRCPLPAAGRSP